MDPLTHGLLGATAATALLGKKHTRTVLLAGFLGGIIPDIDVLFQSSDPLVNLVYHRHFTHSIFLAPIFGVLGVLPLFLLRRFRNMTPLVIAAGMVGCFTHGLLDALTGYGTVVFWPISNERVALDAMPIVDLFFTPMLLLGCIVAGLTRMVLVSRIALAIALLYILSGFVMSARASAAQAIIAQSRGHRIEAARTMPSPGTLVLWRSVYLHDGHIQLDEIRTPWFGRTLAREGQSVPHLVADDLPTTVTMDPGALRGFRTFSWFADGYTGWVGDDSSGIVGDYRYGGDIMGDPLWGLHLLPGDDMPYRRWSNRGPEGYSSSLWRRLTRGDDRMQPVSAWKNP